MGALVTAVVSVVVALAVIGGLFIALNLAAGALPQRWEARVRPWLFIGPAMLFLSATLIIPAIRTIVLSFQAGSRGEEGASLDNWSDTLGDERVLGFEGAGNILTSRLFLVGVALGVVAFAVARRAACRGFGGDGGRLDLSSPTTSVLLLAGGLVVLFAVFSTLRGVVWNNLWWVAVVVGFSTLLGLAFAVLADRSRRENAAKTLIFMPMAISLVGAAVIWKYIYDSKGAGQSEGLLNIVWPGDQIDFIRGTSSTGTIIPWNNFFIMAIMIWIQTGFAMVVLSAAIKGVPSELGEAARVDGANDAQVFWRVTLPQIRSTILVVVTTLTITVLKIFDLVKATTGGAADTNVLANQMVDELRNGNFTRSSTFAVMILVLVLPVMWLNVRRASREFSR